MYRGKYMNIDEYIEMQMELYHEQKHANRVRMDNGETRVFGPDVDWSKGL